MRCFRRRPKLGASLHLRAFPTLGNHEFIGDPQQGLEHWWNAFPEMRNRRWYSAQLGSRVYLLALDSDTSLLPHSDQADWIEKQIDGLPSSIDFVIVTLHHPPVADIQQHITVDHNPRPNEIALRDSCPRPPGLLTPVFWSVRGTSTITNATWSVA